MEDSVASKNYKDSTETKENHDVVNAKYGLRLHIIRIL